MGKEATIQALTLVLHPHMRGRSVSKSLRPSPDARLDEAVGLAQAIRLSVVQAEVINIRQPRPSTLFGEGVVKKFERFIADAKITLVIVDSSLSPLQQRNLEKAWHCKVIDRTGLILEIFGERARTAEGRVQVELATLIYQRSRLVRSWTHLERQRGGLGFVGGPGETQLEVDRRLIGERIARLKRDLEEVKRTRGLHRKARQKAPYPIVALVGYTNAGKSTLFNRLTQANVLAKDILFATLDPTMRAVTLPSGRVIILSDTVGFISDLPTPLVAAFRATLEEVCAADLILHVRDISHETSEQQAHDVEEALKELGVEARHKRGMFEILNKVDKLPLEKRRYIHGGSASVAMSALTGEGVDALLEMLDRHFATLGKIHTFTFDSTEGAVLAWLYQHGEVLRRDDDKEKITVVARLSAAEYSKFKKLRGASLLSS